MYIIHYYKIAYTFRIIWKGGTKNNLAKMSQKSKKFSSYFLNQPNLDRDKRIKTCSNEIISPPVSLALRIALKLEVNLMKVRTAQKQNVENWEDVPSETPSHVIQEEY